MDAPLLTQPLPLSLHKTLYVFEKDIGIVTITDVAVVVVRPQQIVIELLNMFKLKIICSYYVYPMARTF